MSETVHINSNNTDDNSRVLVRWKNRQRMAWISLVAVITLTLLNIFVVPPFFRYFQLNPSEWSSTISMSLDWAYITLGSVILGYMGSTAWMMRGKKIEMNQKDF